MSERMEGVLYIPDRAAPSEQRDPGPFEFSKFESGGRFGLTITRTCMDITDDSLGSGYGHEVRAFATEEGREYFIQGRRYEHMAKVAAWELACLRNGMREAVMRRNVRKRILELLDHA